MLDTGAHPLAGGGGRVGYRCLACLGPSCLGPPNCCWARAALMAPDGVLDLGVQLQPCVVQNVLAVTVRSFA